MQVLEPLGTLRRWVPRPASGLVSVLPLAVPYSPQYQHPYGLFHSRHKYQCLYLSSLL